MPMADLETATFGGGCFWCTEAVFSELKGVIKAVPGYSGGTVPDPTYEQVCTDATGHAEVVQITFDPRTVGYGDLLEVFFSTHDPTSLNRQGADEGTQYRSVIFYHSNEQREAAESMIRSLNDEKVFARPIVTEVVPFERFFEAEEYHHQYFKRNPYQGYCRAVIAPKLSKFRAHYRERLKVAASATP